MFHAVLVRCLQVVAVLQIVWGCVCSKGGFVSGRFGFPPRRRLRLVLGGVSFRPPPHLLCGGGCGNWVLEVVVLFWRCYWWWWVGVAVVRCWDTDVLKLTLSVCGWCHVFVIRLSVRSERLYAKLMLGVVYCSVCSVMCVCVRALGQCWWPFCVVCILWALLIVLLLFFLQVHLLCFVLAFNKKIGS
jgi:hypothetical protein